MCRLASPRPWPPLLPAFPSAPPMHTGSRVLCAPVDAALAALVELNGAASRDFLLLRFFLSDALAPRGHARLVADRLCLLSHAVASSCTLRLFDGLRASAATSVALVLSE